MFKICSLLLLGCMLLSSCGEKQIHELADTQLVENAVFSTSLIVLGTIQDGGSPHIGCAKACCRDLFKNPDKDRQVVSLGLFDAATQKKYLFEATPDISTQTKELRDFAIQSEHEMPDGIFLTHAHIGHYAGLMFLGKEAMGAQQVPVFAMPGMQSFLKENGPWSQLHSAGNIAIHPLANAQAVQLSDELRVIPFQVPHRDEYSETVGYKILGPNKSALFIPDIDKWEKWERDIAAEIKNVDYGFIDATFFSGKELNNRDMSEIPHPFILESMRKFEELSAQERAKVIFIHFNHTNPVIDPESAESKLVESKGFRIARIREVFEL
ncbi:MBL fold metallo-hydrolase [Algoriphagus halophytocola]|uniref:MBL fold metallo-hydrolase n=1 Tax=Algoriphagus halophytocola TaxID=2991499 RepID=A0ABY6MK75_9BACT|nr:MULTISPECIES: MBL fold metallo-hydrolase [unclassified Algoriphagus]UZD24165.1 MBL fold metallo-hydrolase [Algoriphagus sp. TR-M5]WBL41536.1 MBL fold metallo-hydrolase [Algoriphagus sp. TR-M9]